LQGKIQIFSPVKQRILQFVDTLNISKREFYLNTGISRGTLESQTGITEETITKVISKYQNISPTWLITGKGKMFLDGDGTHATIDLSNSKKGTPYFELLPASDGDLTPFLSDAKPTSYIDLPQITDCIAVLPVYGSSMKGVIEPGDLIAIKEVRSRIEFDPSMPYLIITDEHRMIKYLHLDEEDDTIVWAQSVNIPRIRLHIENILKVYAIKCVIRLL
jgi:hypothetical protein